MRSGSKKKTLSRGGKTAERIFNRLVEGIVTGSVPSGLPFREAEFAKRWGVSRTPMREAVRRAAETGLLVLRHNRAPVIRSFSRADIASLYELREVLEIFAFKQAFDLIPRECIIELQALAKQSLQEDSIKWIDSCLEFDRRLHLSWTTHCHNPWLTESLSRIWTFIRILQRYMAQDKRLAVLAAKEHRQILEAMTTGNKRRGLEALRQHIRNSRGAVVSVTAN